jgi:hypothetical protein
MLPRLNQIMKKLEALSIQGSRPLRQYIHYELNMSIAGIEPGWGG